MPTIGEKSAEYPHGYGFCQCGCGRKTRLTSGGSFSKYARVTHHPSYKSTHPEQAFQPKAPPAAIPAVDPNPSPGRLHQKSGSWKNNHSVVDELTERHLDLLEKAKRLEIQVQQLRLTIEFSISFLERCWEGDPSAKRVLTGRLRAVLPKQSNEEGASAKTGMPPN